MPRMTKKDKDRLRRDFLLRAGSNVQALVAAMENLPNVGFYILDDQCRIIAINRHNRDVCNFKSEREALGQNCLSAFPGKRGEIYTRTHDQVRKTGRPLRTERIVPADSSLTPLTATFQPLRDGDGRIIGTMCIYTPHPPSTTPPEWHGRFQELTAWMNQSYMRKIKLPALAQRVSMSTTVFYQRFKQLFGMSPGDYLATIRINAARELLRSSDKSIADIAQATGFWDQSHFVRVFKQKRGMTPGEYRKQIKI